MNTVKPEQVGCSSERLKRIGLVMQRYVDEDKIAGILAMAVRRGQKGELGDARLVGRKTIELMTMNHLPDELHPFEDPSRGFGLGVSVLTDVAKSQTLGSVGTYGWGGAANTTFWVDPKEELIGLLMLQFMPNNTYPVVPDFKVSVYQLITD